MRLIGAFPMNLIRSILFVVCCFTASTSARASVWLCSSIKAGGLTSYVNFLIVDQTLIEQPNEARFRILENNDHALLAEFHYADFDPVLMSLNLFIVTLMIDKTSYRFTHTMVLSGHEARQSSGNCRFMAFPNAQAR